MNRIDFPLPPGFAFDEAAHAYTVNGRVVSGVTGTIRRAGLMGSAVDFYTEYSRERGTAVHDMMKLAQEDDLDEASIDERLAGYLAAWKNWRNAVRYMPLLTEQPIYCADPEFAGTLDSAGILNGRLVVIDVKTEHYPAWARLQITAYMLALEAAGLPAAKGIGLCLKGDGTFKVHPYEFDVKNRVEWLETLKGVAA